MITTETHVRQHHLTLSSEQIHDVVVRYAAERAKVKLGRPAITWSVTADEHGSITVLLTEDLMPQEGVAR